MNLLHSLPNETIACIVFIIGMCVYTHAAIFDARTAALAPSLFTTFGIFFKINEQFGDNFKQPFRIEQLGNRRPRGCSSP